MGQEACIEVKRGSVHTAVSTVGSRGNLTGWYMPAELIGEYNRYIKRRYLRRKIKLAGYTGL